MLKLVGGYRNKMDTYPSSITELKCMGKYMTIYRWTPERAKQAAKKLISLMDGTAPALIPEAMSKIKIIDQSFSVANNFMVVIYEIVDEDYPLAMAVANYLADTFDMETYPLVSGDNHARIWDQLALSLD